MTVVVHLLLQGGLQHQTLIVSRQNHPLHLHHPHQQRHLLVQHHLHHHLLLHLQIGEMKDSQVHMDEEALEVEVVVVETGIQQIEMTRLREKNINNHSNNRNLVKMIEVPVEV